MVNDTVVKFITFISIIVNASWTLLIVVFETQKIKRFAHI